MELLLTVADPRGCVPLHLDIYVTTMLLLFQTWMRTQICPLTPSDVNNRSLPVTFILQTHILDYIGYVYRLTSTQSRRVLYVLILTNLWLYLCTKLQLKLDSKNCWVTPLGSLSLDPLEAPHPESPTHSSAILAPPLIITAPQTNPAVDNTWQFLYYCIYEMQWQNTNIPSSSISSSVVLTIFNLWIILSLNINLQLIELKP